MQDVLFRGKRKDNGEWVYGYLFKTINTCYIAYSEQFDDDLFFATENIFIEVIPETVGQYTGLTDKNWVKIFEGDILSVGCIDSDEVRNCIVRFGEFTDVNGDGDIMLGFFLEFNDFKCSILNGKDLGHSLSDVCEVIGNIHDEPKGDAE